MREQLIQYVELLFAGAPDSQEIKQEILQNTLDRYDDLIAQGKQPEAAYSLAISGIGDVSELLSKEAPTSAPTVTFDPSRRFSPEARNAPVWKKLLRAAAVFLYIISVIPLMVLAEFGMEIIGFCGTLGIVAVATALIIIASGGKSTPKQEEPAPATPQDELQRAVKSICGIASVCVYLVVSFATGAWHITWLIFPITAAIKGLIKAIIDLKEAEKHEI